MVSLEGFSHKMTRRMGRAIDYTAILLVLWALAGAIPLRWLGFNPGIVEVVSGPAPNVVLFSRHIERDIRLRYSVVVRAIETLDIACEAYSNAFTYRAQPGGPITKDLAWWAPGDARCASLPLGQYAMETCWTWPSPIPFIPNKFICRMSNIFEVTE